MAINSVRRLQEDRAARGQAHQADERRRQEGRACVARAAIYPHATLPTRPPHQLKISLEKKHNAIYDGHLAALQKVLDELLELKTKMQGRAQEPPALHLWLPLCARALARTCNASLRP